jgi:hypothetical protein
MSFLANVFTGKHLSGQTSSAQMSFWANDFIVNFSWTNVYRGKRIIGTGKMFYFQMYYGQTSFGAIVSGQMSLGKCRIGKCRITYKRHPKKPLCVKTLILFHSSDALSYSKHIKMSTLGEKIVAPTSFFCRFKKYRKHINMSTLGGKNSGTNVRCVPLFWGELEMEACDRSFHFFHTRL